MKYTMQCFYLADIQIVEVNYDTEYNINAYF